MLKLNFFLSKQQCLTNIVPKQDFNEIKEFSSAALLILNFDPEIRIKIIRNTNTQPHKLKDKFTGKAQVSAPVLRNADE